MSFRSPESKLVPLAAAAQLAADLRARGKNIVTTNGCFDLLHLGHTTYLVGARRLGDLLWVGVNSDASVKGLGKGDDRPLTEETARALQIAALECVDYVTLFNEANPNRFLEAVRPGVHAKGKDYEGKKIPELAVLAGFGGIMRYVDLVPGYSTTALIEKIKSL